MSSRTKLPRSFFSRATLTIARELIGMHLLHDDGRRVRAGRIVEAEAYLGPRDLAAHSSHGRTARTEVMFGPPGHAYVYFVYGVWHCLNVVTGAPGVPHAVLLRALEPLRGIAGGTWGPGLLCRAMHIDRRLNGVDLRGDVLWLERPGRSRAPRIGRSTRIGVDYAGAWAERRWRFFDRASAYVSTAPAQGRSRTGRLRSAERAPRGSRRATGKETECRSAREPSPRCWPQASVPPSCPPRPRRRRASRGSSTARSARRSRPRLRGRSR